MGCCGSTANVPEASQPASNVPGTVQIPMQVRVPVPMPTPPASTSDHAPSNSSRRTRTHSQHSMRRSTDRSDAPSRSRAISAPQHVKPTKPSSSQHPQHSLELRKRANTSVGPRASGSTPRPPNPAHPRAGGRSLAPTMRQLLPTGDHSKFRILVVGKKGSGKTSLINSVFKVNLPVVPGRSDINREIVPEDNRYLIVHESSGFGPGDGQNLQDIRDFISERTHCSTDKKVHAIWICIPFSDMTEDARKGVMKIVDMARVPVVVAFTKFDASIVINGIAAKDHENGRAKAYAYYEEKLRSSLRNDKARIAIVDVGPLLGDHTDDIVMQTDELIRAQATGSTRKNMQITPVPFLWSAALREDQDIFIQASIENGRSRYWRGLWSSLDFADQLLKDCVNVIHTDIVDIWNLKDRNKHLSDRVFKEKMSHVVQDLAESAASVPSTRSGFAEWVYDVYRGSQENVRCVMGYIVDLTVILGDIFRTASGNCGGNNVQLAIDRHVNSGRRDRIHRDIHSFVTETFAIRFAEPQRDLVLEKIIDLIRQYCVAG